MRYMFAFALLASSLPTPAPAQGQSSAARAMASHYTTAVTPIGTLFDDPAAKAVIAKHAPAIASNPQIDMARDMTLKSIQAYAGDALSDDVLRKIDADLAKLPAKK